MTRIRDLSTFNAVRNAGLAKLLPSRPRIAVGMGTCGSGNGAEGVYHAFADAIDQRGLDVQLVRTGCFGFCAEEPLVNVSTPGPAAGHPPPRADQPRRPDSRRAGGEDAFPTELALCKIEDWDHLTGQVNYGSGYPDIPSWNEVPFFKGQKKIVLRNCGLINPDDIEEYIAVGGYQSLYKVLIDGTPERVNEQIKSSRAARARRRRLLDRLEMGIPAQGRGRAEIPHLQRRRRRPRRLHEPQRNRGRPAFAARRHGDRRLRDRGHAGDHLCPRRISAGGSPPERGASLRPTSTARSARTFLAAASTSISSWSRAQALSSAAKRRRSSARSRACRAVPPASALPGPEGSVGPADQHQQRRDLVQHRAIVAKGPAWFNAIGSAGARHQGVLAGRQGQEHRPGRDAAGHAAEQVRL